MVGTDVGRPCVVDAALTGRTARRGLEAASLSPGADGSYAHRDAAPERAV